MSTPEGWYPDPSDHAQLRWWDGSGWTQHTHAAPPVQVPDLTKAPHHPGDGPHAPGPDQRTPGRGFEGYGRTKAIATPDGQALAGLGYRLGARLLDWLFVLVITGLAGWNLLERLVRLSLANAEAAGAGDFAASVRLAQSPEMLAISSGLTTILLAVSAVYTILPLKFYGATPGKLICGIRVRHWEKAGPPSWWQAVVRWVTSDAIGSWVPFYQVADYAFPLFDRRKQALHDKLGGTVVVHKDHRDDVSRSRSGS